MLARKYYAQQGTSKGRMNTNAVTQSSSSRGKRLRFWRQPVAKNMTAPTADEKTNKDKLVALKCGTINGTNPQYNSDAICNVVKEQKGKVISSEKTENVLSKQIC